MTIFNCDCSNDDYDGDRPTLVASDVWDALGDPHYYVEPFAGSLAVLLARPDDHKKTMEIVNDKDGYISNFWRAVSKDPDQVAHYADWPINEVDLTARHIFLVNSGREMTDRLLGDYEFYDPKIAGFWLSGICQWIGHGFCSGNGPYNKDENGRIAKIGHGVSKQRPFFTHNRGIYQGASKQISGGESRGQFILDWMRLLQQRLERVVVCCGDWKRVCNSNYVLKEAGIFLDPPYSHDVRDPKLYNEEADIKEEIQDWCIDHSDLRIVLCGYECEHEILVTDHGWSVKAWKAGGGFANRGDDRENRLKERLYFSPSCLNQNRYVLFAGQYDFLDNSYPSPMIYQGRTYPSAWHLFYAMQTDSDSIRRRIPFWDKQRLSISVPVKNPNLMVDVIRLKFSNPELRGKLRQLDLEQIEYNNYEHDNYWGVCRCQDCQDEAQDILGSILEEVRDELD